MTFRKFCIFIQLHISFPLRLVTWVCHALKSSFSSQGRISYYLVFFYTLFSFSIKIINSSRVYFGVRFGKGCTSFSLDHWLEHHTRSQRAACSIKPHGLQVLTGQGRRHGEWGDVNSKFRGQRDKSACSERES